MTSSRRGSAGRLYPPRIKCPQSWLFRGPPGKNWLDVQATNTIVISPIIAPSSRLQKLTGGSDGAWPRARASSGRLSRCREVDSDPENMAATRGSRGLSTIGGGAVSCEATVDRACVVCNEASDDTKECVARMYIPESLQVIPILLLYLHPTMRDLSRLQDACHDPPALAEGLPKAQYSLDVGLRTRAQSLARD